MNKRQDYYTEEEIEYIKKNYVYCKHGNVQKIADKLGRTKAGVKRKINAMLKEGEIFG
ncbi:DNA binding protein [Bacillus phage 000TH010]|uniref:DNA binding protein n=1 Tax=Bacillus phage 000TH010 TaxID=2601652 RepID=A0A5P8PHV2_9CAUD|nr:DNA binding protein [Bacillus phage 000TH010]QFR56281.1 DNA binding protein [Bacillus phage 000TH010]